MEEKILVSVIIPVYQTEKYLWHCVESVIKQSYKNLEILLIDDGSTDKSPAICDNLAKSDKRVRVFHQQNGGISSARNTGLKNALGTYITFLDSDDFLHRHFIKYLLSLCLREEAQLAVSALYTGSGSDFSGISMKGGFLTTTGKEALLSRKMKSGVVGKLYQKELFEGLLFPVSDHFNYEDEALIYRLLYRSQRVVSSEKPLYYYYRNPSSTTRKENHYKPVDFYDVLKDRINFFSGKDKELFEYSWEYLCLNLMRFYINCKEDPLNTNNMEEILLLYEKAFYKVLYNHVTPLNRKLMFTCFYFCPVPCAFFANKAGFRLKRLYQSFKTAERRHR